MSHPVQLKKLLLVSTVSMMAALLPATRADATVDPTQLPEGFNLVAGDVDDPSVSGASMGITQNSGRAVIDWQTFDIGKDAKVTFNQTAGASSVVVNRVTNSSINGSQILGQLLANGKVVILDRNGVLFGATSKVNVGGIVASTGTLTNNNQNKFMNGQAFALTDINANAAAKIINETQNFNVEDSGLVAFVAPAVYNNGVINARLGKVTLASGDKVTVDLTGDNLITLAAGEGLENAYVENAGTINARGGVVTMTAKAASGVVDSVVNMKGVINATTYQQKNGKIVLSATNGKVRVAGTLDASTPVLEGGAGTTAGSIDVKGKDIEVTSDAVLKAASVGSSVSTSTIKWCILLDCRTNKNDFPSYLRGLAQQKTITTTTTYDGNGNGGSVSLNADNSLLMNGQIDVSAGALGGDGGSALLRGDTTLGFGGLVNASAANGLRGSARLRSGTISVGDLVSTTSLASSLGYADVTLVGTDGIVFTGDTNLSRYGFLGLQTTGGDLRLNAPVISLGGDLTVGAGGLTFANVDTFNLNGRFYRHAALLSLPSLLGRDDLRSTATTVNVLSGDADINQAIHLASSTALATVNVSAGTYVAFQPFDIYKSLRLMGTDATLLGIPGAASIVNVSADDVTVDGFTLTGLLADTGISASRVSGLTVSGNNFNSVTGAAVSLDRVSNSLIDGNTVTGAGAGVSATGGHDLTISGNTISAVARGIETVRTDAVSIDGNTIAGTLAGDAISVRGAQGAGVSGNIVLAAAGNGISVAGSSDVTVERNIVAVAGGDALSLRNVTGADVHLNAVGGAVNGISVAGSSDVDVYLNLVAANSGDGIRLANTSDADVYLNAVLASGDDGISVRGGEDVLVAANLVLGTGGYGIRVAGTDNVQVLLNAMIDSGLDGIYINGATNSVALLNAIVNAGGNGVRVNGSDGAVVALNLIDGAGTDGVHVSDSDGAIVAANAISNVDGDGVSISDSSRILAALNKISTVGGNGVRVSGGDSHLIVLNDIDDTGKNGVLVKDATGVAVLANQVDTAGRNGIALDGVTAGVVALNDVDGTVADGIRISDSVATLTIGNDVANAGRNGIALDGGAFNALVDNDVTTSGANGIRVSSTVAALIAGNDVDGTVTDGIRISDSAATLTIGNDVANAGRNGIALDGGAFNALIDNDVTTSGANGISVVESDNLLLIGNTVTGSDKNGLRVLRADNVIAAGNTISASGRDGIRFAGSTGLIVGNTVTGTGHNGVSVVDGSAAVIDNTVTGAGRNGIRLRNADGSMVVINTIDGAGRNGIAVARSGNVWVVGNNVSNATQAGVALNHVRNSAALFNTVDGGEAGIAITGGRKLLVAGNTLSGSKNGIIATGAERVLMAFNTIKGYVNNGVQLIGSSSIALFGNTIDGEGAAGTTGIRLGADNAPGAMDGSDDIIIAGNDIIGNDVGLSALAFNNGDIVLAGNTFTDNTVGVWAGSGTFDMTGATNTFTGGDTALRFERQSLVDPQTQTSTYADLALVDNTIGSTVFEGQSGYYVDLRNRAFFENGAPLLIDGTQATYDGVAGGLMTPSQLLAIRAKIHDFNNDPTLGLFFAGYASLDDNLLMRRVLGNTYRTGRASIVINNRPLPPSSSGRGNQFFNIQDLAGLEPAAGGDDQQPSASDLATLEPAAGEASAQCWSNVGGGAASVTLDLSGDENALLNGRSGCSGDI